MRVDLDNAEKVAGELHEDTAELIWDLVAELRAACEELEAAREFAWAFDRWRDTHEGWQVVLDARNALAAYDQAAGS
jgi:hypothetical protein